MNSIIIKLNNQELVIKQSIRALQNFEKITGKSVFKMNEDLTDMLTLFYCILKANNKTFNYSMDEFLELLDNEPEAFESYNQFVQKNAEEATTETEDKKKVIQ